MSFLCGVLASLAFHGQWCARAHCSNSRCPPAAAAEQVSSSHGQWCSRGHFNISTCPPSAAPAQQPRFGSATRDVLLPRAAVLPRPHQRLLGDRPEQRSHNGSTHSTGSFAPGATQPTPRGARRERRVHNNPSPGRHRHSPPFDSRAPAPTAAPTATASGNLRTRPGLPRAPVVLRPSQPLDGQQKSTSLSVIAPPFPARRR